MAKQRFFHMERITVEACERCNKSHVFPVEIIFDREMDKPETKDPNNETHAIIVICPNTGKDMVVTVPVEKDTQQILIAIRRQL